MPVDASKGKSPFYPGQPVPVELFVGRSSQIGRIMRQGAGQVAAGKPVAMYVQGEYGIGKSSIASFTQWLAEREYALHPIYVTLGGAHDIGDVAASVLEATIRSGVFHPTKSEQIKVWLAKYIGSQTILGFSINFAALKQDAPNLSTPFGMLGFLSEAYQRLKEAGATGIFLVLDEINGITGNPQFAHFLKGVVDANALSQEPLPLLLMLCGVEERRREMIENHRPIDRIFDIIETEPLSDEDMREFFERAFASVQMSVAPDAMWTMTHYSAGFPKIVHMVGDAAFWIDTDGTVDKHDAITAVLVSADDVGKKYVDQQVYKALQSADYRSILAKIGKLGPDKMSFTRDEVVSGLSESEKRKFDNFLQKMKRLNVIQSGDVRGEYVFIIRMVRVYIWLQSLNAQTKAEDV